MVHGYRDSQKIEHRAIQGVLGHDMQEGVECEPMQAVRGLPRSEALAGSTRDCLIQVCNHLAMPFGFNRGQ